MAPLTEHFCSADYQYGGKLLVMRAVCSLQAAQPARVSFNSGGALIARNA